MGSVAAVDVLRHPAPNDPSRGLIHRLAATGAPSKLSARIALTISKASGRLSIIAVRYGMGVFLRWWLANHSGSTPFLPLTRNLIRHPSASNKPFGEGDPTFTDKVRDIVGLHQSPTAPRALVLRAHERSQIRALDRMHRRRCRAFPNGGYDCERDGTTSLFDAPNVAVDFVV